MVEFISHVDDPEVPPPYDFSNISMMSFRLTATQANLQALCDKFLNIGDLADRGFEYRALTNFVDMEMLTYPEMRFTKPPYSGCFASQQELYFRFFVWKFISVSGVLIPDPIPELFMPFIFVDNSWSMISGRTVIGFPKVMAQFSSVPAANAAPFHITASALALTSFQKTKLDWKPIVKIDSSTGPAQPISDGLWPWIGLGAEVVDPILQDFPVNFPAAFSTIQLKQFRDAQCPDEACYQALVGTPFTPTKVGLPTLLPPVTVTVEQYASLDIPGTLGFKPGVPLQPTLQYAMKFGMTIGSATNIFVNT